MSVNGLVDLLFSHVLMRDSVVGFEVLHGEYEDHSSCILKYRYRVS